MPNFTHLDRTTRAALRKAYEPLRKFGQRTWTGPEPPTPTPDETEQPELKAAQEWHQRAQDNAAYHGAAVDAAQKRGEDVTWFHPLRQAHRLAQQQADVAGKVLAGVRTKYGV